MNKKRVIFLILAFSALVSRVAFSSTEIAFSGHLDFSKNQFDVVFDLEDQGAVSLNAQKISDNDYNLQINVERLKASDVNFSSEIESAIKFVSGEDDLNLRGRINSRYSLFNFKPTRELSGYFEIKDKKLHLKKLSIGHILCDGSVGLSYPYAIDLDFSLSDIEMDDFLNFWMKNKGYSSGGGVSGEIKAAGTLERLLLKGSLESYQGFVKDFEFDSIRLNIAGIYPEMQIAQSTISKTTGLSYALDGPFDLSNQKNFKKQITSLSISPLVSDSQSESEWTIKQYRQDDSSTTELKYLLRKGDNMGLSGDEESDMLGLERTVEF